MRRQLLFQGGSSQDDNLEFQIVQFNMKIHNTKTSQSGKKINSNKLYVITWYSNYTIFEYVGVLIKRKCNGNCKQMLTYMNHVTLNIVSSEETKTSEIH